MDYIISTQIRFDGFLKSQISTQKIFTRVDFTSWYEGCKHPDNENGCFEACWFRLGTCDQHFQERTTQPLHKSRGDAVVSTTRTPPRRSKLRSTGRHVGRWLYYGRNVDTLANHARLHRATTTHTLRSIMWFFHHRHLAGSPETRTLSQNGTASKSQAKSKGTSTALR